MKQFTYAREVVVKKEDGTTETVERIDSLNLTKIIRTVELDNGNRLVTLDDFHTEKRPEPILNKAGKVTGYKNAENTYQSEIILNRADGDRLLDELNEL
jgi:hypothetical protein